MAFGGDFASPAEVEKVFERVRGAWGEPTVVVYNGMNFEIIVLSDTTSDDVPC